MHVFTLFLALLASCASATAAAPPSPPTPTDPAALAALARDTAVSLGLAPPVMRDDLELVFEPASLLPEGMTIIRVIDRDHGTGLRIVFAHDLAGRVRAVAAWPI
jgi:hypothetical protein